MPLGSKSAVILALCILVTLCFAWPQSTSAIELTEHAYCSSLRGGERADLSDLPGLQTSSARLAGKASVARAKSAPESVQEGKSHSSKTEEQGTSLFWELGELSAGCLRNIFGVLELRSPERQSCERVAVPSCPDYAILYVVTEKKVLLCTL